MGDRLIFHIDVNSAYLSWEAVYRLQHGCETDLREVPSIVGGNEEKRHGIVLAKSLPAKACGIKTGNSLLEARQKCRDLIIVPPHYDLYMMSSNAMQSILEEYTPNIQRFSIDESFLDFTGMENLYGKDFLKLAGEIKDRIKKELGFTVNIGISSNKLLAKIACDFQKPDRIHTLFPNEIKEKMWALDVGDLFMVGRATEKKLRKLNINTIGELAAADIELLKYHLKSHGILIQQYANGIENSEVRKSNYIEMKGIGNSTTIAFDVDDDQTAHLVLLSLSETVGMRLRASGNCCRLVSVSVRTNEFSNYSKQRKLFTPIDSTKHIAATACKLFDEVWKGENVRHLGVHVSELCCNEFYQTSLFDDKDFEKQKRLDRTIDEVRVKYGNSAIIRSVFLNSGIKPTSGGVGEDDYPMMASML